MQLAERKGHCAIIALMIFGCFALMEEVVAKSPNIDDAGALLACNHHLALREMLEE